MTSKKKATKKPTKAVRRKSPGAYDRMIRSGVANLLPKKTRVIHDRVNTSTYKPEHCQTLIELMREGCALVNVCAEIGTSPDNFQVWLKKFPELSDAYKIGRALSEAWWTEMARQNLLIEHQGSRLNTSLWHINMQNRFGWTDKRKIEHTGEDGGPIEINATVSKMETARRIAFHFRDALESDDADDAELNEDQDIDSAS